MKMETLLEVYSTSHHNCLHYQLEGIRCFVSQFGLLPSFDENLKLLLLTFLEVAHGKGMWGIQGSIEGQLYS